MRKRDERRERIEIRAARFKAEMNSPSLPPSFPPHSPSLSFVRPPLGDDREARLSSEPMSTSRQKSPAEQLATPVQFLKGAGPERAALLQKLGLNTVRDVLFFFPRAYEDTSQVRRIDELVDGDPASVWGVVEDIDMRNTGTGRSILGVLIRQGPDHLRALWFNQPFQRQKFFLGARVMFSGVPKQHGLRWEMTHPRIFILGEQETPTSGQILPIYALTEGLQQPSLRKLVQTAVEGYASLLDEAFPEDFLDEHRLWPIRAALPQIHVPTTRDTLNEARRRFVYQELLVLQLALALRREKRMREQKAPVLATSPLIDSRIFRLFPFDLTPDQRQAITEIAGDMGRETPMNRLLQGDVGSGKTVIAMYAMLLAVAHGHQAVLMAPTEVLARQHARNLQRSLAASRVRIGVLTGGLSVGERRELMEKIASGQIDLVIGTHAVVHAVARGEARFAKLGLVVIDEQHKFGVRQRSLLKQAALAPHYLVMTATPIPRTVAMTLFGDLDVSTLRSAPPGRQPIHSYFVGDEKRDAWWDFFRRKLREGRQGYVIAPLVEGAEEDAEETAGAEEGNSRLAEASETADSAEAVEAIESTDASHAQLAAEPSSLAVPPPAPVSAAPSAVRFVPKTSDGGELLLTPIQVPTDDASPTAPTSPLANPLANVEQLYEELVNGPLAEFRVDLIHGRMTPAQKEAAMEAFRTGETQVLVATSVVEVGVDVPNASVMTIDSGERFGLAQLHQLRGRIGRGKHPGYLTVFAQPKSDESRQRLEAFVRSTDGFELAELDFGLRGPGELFGIRQHGLPPLRVADLQRDAATVLEARRDAQALLAADPGLSDPRWSRLRRMVLVRYGEALELGDVG